MFGSWLKAAREGRGWTQSELARRTGLAPSAINRLEKDPKRRPNEETAIRLATAFGFKSVEDMYRLAYAGGTVTATQSLDSDPRLKNWPADMLTRLHELYPDMDEAELEMAIDLGVDALRRIKQHEQQQSQQRLERSTGQREESSPTEEHQTPRDPSSNTRASA